MSANAATAAATSSMMFKLGSKVFTAQVPANATDADKLTVLKKLEADAAAYVAAGGSVDAPPARAAAAPRKPCYHFQRGQCTTVNCRFPHVIVQQQQAQQPQQAQQFAGPLVAGPAGFDGFPQQAGAAGGFGNVTVTAPPQAFQQVRIGVARNVRGA